MAWIDLLISLFYLNLKHVSVPVPVIHKQEMQCSLLVLSITKKYL